MIPFTEVPSERGLKGFIVSLNGVSQFVSQKEQQVYDSIVLALLSWNNKLLAVPAYSKRGH